MSTRMMRKNGRNTRCVSGLPAIGRGRKAEDDRRFLEALHFFTVENVRWRAFRSASALEQRMETL